MSVSTTHHDAKKERGHPTHKAHHLKEIVELASQRGDGKTEEELKIKRVNEMEYHSIEYLQ